MIPMPGAVNFAGLRDSESPLPISQVQGAPDFHQFAEIEESNSFPKAVGKG
jgi:hypothetical protein